MRRRREVRRVLGREAVPRVARPLQRPLRVVVDVDRSIDEKQRDRDAHDRQRGRGRLSREGPARRRRRERRRRRRPLGRERGHPHRHDSDSVSICPPPDRPPTLGCCAALPASLSLLAIAEPVQGAVLTVTAIAVAVALVVPDRRRRAMAMLAAPARRCSRSRRWPPASTSRTSRRCWRAPRWRAGIVVRGWRGSSTAGPSRSRCWPSRPCPSGSRSRSAIRPPTSCSRSTR